MVVSKRSVILTPLSTAFTKEDQPFPNRKIADVMCQADEWRYFQTFRFVCGFSKPILNNH